MAANDGYTALMLAAKNGHAGMVRLLLDAGAEANLIAQNGRTALTLATKGNHKEVARMLLTTNVTSPPRVLGSPNKAAGGRRDSRPR